MDLARYSKEYIASVESFLDFAYSYGDPQGEEIQCPCAKRCNIHWTRRNDIKFNVYDDMDYSPDDIDGLLNDEFRDVAHAEGVYDGPNEDAKKFHNLVEEASQELYHGMIIRMMNFVILVELHDILNLLKLIECSKDGKFRHPVDGLAWKNFDRLHPDFALDCRNVRLGLSSDGFNPFRTMSISHSTWPVMLMHNLLRHNLDVMHIKKNIVDSILGTLSDISSKTKDHAKARFNKRARNNDECDPSDAETVSLFPNKEVLGAKKSDPFFLDNKSLSQAHAYLLGNCDEVQEYIREHEQEVNNQPRRSKWSKAKNHFQNFSQWFETRALQEDVPDLIKQLSRGRNFVAKRYFGYLINGYRFHVRQRDARCKTQNSGVTVVASTTSFAISKDKNLIAADLTYYGRIVDIVELDYYGHFKVVLFKCDRYEVENDTYGLTYVYFNKRCSLEEPFVLGSQVHQCFYVQDPYDQDRHYVMKTIPRDLFNMGDQVESNLPQSYENEPSEHLMGPSIPKDNVEYEEEIEDEFEDEFENEYEDESKDELEDESEDELEDESEEEFEDDAP
ncbi:hypothetical protein KY290_003787 [Solanum tuberosum]|uniref:Uncharacterized protein n=1 Tax=Solanum tuberosum TaxID=4113 RepID=A0ABQ7WTY5_SOLTU|nr:hypothetical protein KY289_000863 [Solanum tuberosum]KAH0784189.1 hypothetical protein KY290_003787 [Solanum tuberosum]